MVGAGCKGGPYARRGEGGGNGIKSGLRQGARGVNVGKPSVVSRLPPDPPKPHQVQSPFRI